MPELPSSESTIGAIALAGGKSSRMGRDKALLEINGKPLLQKICEIASDCRADPIYIVTPWEEKYKSLYLPKQCRFIAEPEPKSSLTGFALGLSYFVKASQESSRDNWVLLLACDLPNLNPDTIKSWADELITLPLAAIAYLPKFLKWEPLCGFYRTSCLKSLEAHIQNGDYSFQAWLSQSLVIEIPNVNIQMLFNCNTPDDFQLIEAFN